MHEGGVFQSPQGVLFVHITPSPSCAIPRRVQVRAASAGTPIFGLESEVKSDKAKRRSIKGASFFFYDFLIWGLAAEIFAAQVLTWFEWFIFDERAKIWQVWAIGTVSPCWFLHSATERWTSNTFEEAAMPSESEGELTTVGLPRPNRKRIFLKSGT